MSDFDTGPILKGLRDLMATVSANRFITNRPEANGKMNDFVVVSLPYDRRPWVYGTGFGCRTRCQIELYTRDKGGQMDVLKLDDMTRLVGGVLPATVEGVRISGVRSALDGSDGFGFGVRILQAEVF
jgi:hypothetical protein